MGEAQADKVNFPLLCFGAARAHDLVSQGTRRVELTLLH